MCYVVNYLDNNLYLCRQQTTKNMAKKENTTSIGFEDAIWRAADKLRGNLNASEYEGVVLGLIFLKYISDKFEAKYQELLQEPDADVEDKDEYEADNVFFVPQEARWQVISLAAHTPQIGKVIDDALEAIERENTKLKGVLPGNYAKYLMQRCNCVTA